MMRDYSVFRVGKVWHVRFQLDGRRVQKSTGETNRVRGFEVAKQTWEDALRRSHGEEPMPTLRGLVDLWMQAHGRTRSKGHLESVERFGRLHLYDLGRLNLDQITTERVEKARALHLADHAPASANHWMRVLNLLVRWAIKRKMIRWVPWDVKMLKLQKQPRAILPVKMTRAWLSAVSEVANPHVVTACMLMLGMGLREAEALGARWEWLDWDRRTYTPGETKGREADPLPVPFWLFEHLEPMRKTEGLIIPALSGKPHSKGYTRRAFKAANATVGVVGLTPHRLRGTFATLLSEAGVSVQTIQRMMRHKDSRTTMFYLEADLARVVQAQSDLGRKMGFARRKSGEPCQPDQRQD